MLRIVLPENEYYDEAQELFVTEKGQILQLEHSLVSISKWESKWCKAFLGKEEKTPEETIDYVKCMTLTQNVDEETFERIGRSPELIQQIGEYIDAPMTATWFSNETGKSAGSRSTETVTSELIYYWMIALQIPVEFQKWHLNRLLTLIKVCNIKNTPPKKMSKKELMNRNKQLNAARRANLHSKG